MGGMAACSFTFFSGQQDAIGEVERWAPHLRAKSSPIDIGRIMTQELPRGCGNLSVGTQSPYF